MVVIENRSTPGSALKDAGLNCLAMSIRSPAERLLINKPPPSRTIPLLVRLQVKSMKFVCLGYIAPSSFENLPKDEQQTRMNECFDYDDELRRGKHFLGGEALQPARNAVT